MVWRHRGAVTCLCVLRVLGPGQALTHNSHGPAGEVPVYRLSHILYIADEETESETRSHAQEPGFFSPLSAP